MAENQQKHDDPVWKSLSRKNGDINKLTKEGLQKELAKLKLDTRLKEAFIKCTQFCVTLIRKRCIVLF